MSVADVLVLAAAGSYVVGYLIINQVVLRLFVLAGTVFYIGYYAVVADQPLWTAIWTSVALGLANIIGLWLLRAAQSRRFLSPELAELYDRVEDFGRLPPGDFRTLFKAGRRHVYGDAAVLIRENAANDKLFFVLDGSAVAEKRGHRFELPSGIFVGEVGYLLNQPASATITVPAGTEAIIWDFETLRKKSRRPRFKLALEAMISRDLSRKVAQAVAPFHIDGAGLATTADLVDF
ncbi:MAG: cyclic nucleotide-binding domain-containing protein [Pseudomonadota bacterium]